MEAALKPILAYQRAFFWSDRKTLLTFLLKPSLFPKF
jgi:hypothetical protein